MDTLIKVTPERFAQGMSIQQFIDNMSKNRELFEENYRTFELREEDEAYFKSLQSPLKVLVLAEDWCGDVLRFLPTFARIAEVAPQWGVRVFRRDENTDLADLWLKSGQFRAIPVFVFFDEKMNELGHFIERPAEVYAEDKRAYAQFAAEHPDLSDAALPYAEMSESTQALYAPFMREYRAANRVRWQQMFVESMKTLLEERP